MRSPCGGTPLSYTLVSIADWCKNTIEVVDWSRINTDHSFHRHNFVLLFNGVPCVQFELKTPGINPRHAMAQRVEYKNDFGNGYGTGSRRPADTLEDDLTSRCRD